MTQEPDDDGHPIAYMCEKQCTSALRNLLSTNAALYSPRMTNLYSRVGGAYLGGPTTHNKMRKGIAYMPIYANSTKERLGATEIPNKHLSGIVIRGPNHARNPTDRIPMITIEMLKSNDENGYLLSKVGKVLQLVDEEEDIIYAVRINSIMKEDTAYLTYTSTALFSLINAMGLLTLEDPDVPQACNMMELIRKGICGSKEWMRERFSEGVLMAAVGNSRDEGYLASLRKMFMVVLSWKRGNHSANWDISSFCTKTNETLIDNPLSMHFHLTLLDILRQYSADPMFN